MRLVGKSWKSIILPVNLRVFLILFSARISMRSKYFDSMNGFQGVLVARTRSPFFFRFWTASVPSKEVLEADSAVGETVWLGFKLAPGERPVARTAGRNA